jgi:hypothetical protein
VENPLIVVRGDAGCATDPFSNQELRFSQKLLHGLGWAAAPGMNEKSTFDAHHDAADPGRLRTDESWIINQSSPTDVLTPLLAPGLDSTLKIR